MKNFRSFSLLAARMSFTMYSIICSFSIVPSLWAAKPSKRGFLFQLLMRLL